MAAPVIDQVLFDKPLYEVGDTITATVKYTSYNTHGGAGDVPYSLGITVTDPTTGETVTSAGYGFTVDTGSAVPDVVDISVADTRTPPGAWTLVSNQMSATSGGTSTAIFTSTA